MTDAPTLANSSRCFNCNLSDGMVWPTFLYVLVQTNQGIRVSTDAPTLANAARCYDCIVDQGMFLPVAAYVIEKTAAAETVSTDPAVLVNEARCWECNGTTPAMLLKALVDLNVVLTA